MRLILPHAGPATKPGFWPPGILPGMACRADIMVMPSDDRHLEAHGHEH
jgi:hypothetical protein